MNNFERNGNEVLYNGFNGKQLDCNIFSGLITAFETRLKIKYIQEKRSMVLLTRQPAEGRNVMVV